MRKKRLGSDRKVAFKFDMSKAYGRVEEDFLEEVIKKLDFDLGGWLRLRSAFLLFLSLIILMGRLMIISLH